MTQINIRPEGSKDAFNVYGGCRKFMTCKDAQAVLYGGTGTGKTTVVALKLVLLSTLYPGSKALATRNSYVALVKSGVETLERVMRELGYQISNKKNSGPNVIYKLGESKPTEYRFPYAKRVDEDGRVYEGQSRILISSLANAKDELGAEYDYVWLNQPELSSEEDWQFLSTRCNGRRGHAPYPQLMGDPNPEHEQHWLWKGGKGFDDYTVFPSNSQLGLGDRWTLIKSTYHDNPTIWDHRLGCFTKQGEEMIERLRQSLDPVMTERLLNGEWCSYEGLAFGDVWNRAECVINAEQLEEFQIDDRWDRYWAIDFGFDHPFVFSYWCKHPEKELYIRTKLIYHSGKTIPEHAQTILNITLGEPRPKLVIADRAPQEIAWLSQELGVNIISAKKHAGTRKAKVSAMYDRLKNREILFYDDALVEADPRLLEKKRPIGFENEVLNLRWKPDSKQEDLIDADDHEMDAASYMFLHLKSENHVVPFIWE
jgi:phage terminase large subunit